ncbi:hypothetical protein O181_071523 [Austropuccinia psidii MF-1]|uniref:Uncharacterized protein n=1 Tax=Austropuccinia psidii MF-1 TaxID=1389203 RepID=A0A9Q3F5R0_9BASI|nr:hypothetical protein [Austropuccinia psidii MF-1]
MFPACVHWSLGVIMLGVLAASSTSSSSDLDELPAPKRRLSRPCHRFMQHVLSYSFSFTPLSATLVQRSLPSKNLNFLKEASESETRLARCIRTWPSDSLVVSFNLFLSILLTRAGLRHPYPSARDQAEAVHDACGFGSVDLNKNQHHELDLNASADHIANQDIKKNEMKAIIDLNSLPDSPTESPLWDPNYNENPSHQVDSNALPSSATNPKTKVCFYCGLPYASFSQKQELQTVSRPQPVHPPLSANKLGFHHYLESLFKGDREDFEDDLRDGCPLETQLSLRGESN